VCIVCALALVQGKDVQAYSYTVQWLNNFISVSNMQMQVRSTQHMLHGEAIWCGRAVWCQRTPSSAINLSQAYLSVSDCMMYIWPIPITLGRVHVCNDILCDIPECDPPRMYVHTYFVGVDLQFREPRTNVLGNNNIYLTTTLILTTCLPV